MWPAPSKIRRSRAYNGNFIQILLIINGTGSRILFICSSHHDLAGGPKIARV
jgi:hypothetical protein